MSVTTRDETMKYLSYNIIYLRKKHKVSKKEMAEILGTGIKTLNNIEKGVLPPRLNVRVLFRIYDCFGISPDYIVSKYIK